MMSVTGTLIVTMAISYQFTRQPTGNSEDALKAAAKATYIQTGAEKDVNKIEKRLEEKYVPQIVKDYGGWIAAIVKVGTEHQISFSWNF